MLLTRKTENQSTGLHIWVSRPAQPISQFEIVVLLLSSH